MKQNGKYISAYIMDLEDEEHNKGIFPKLLRIR